MWKRDKNNFKVEHEALACMMGCELIPLYNEVYQGMIFQGMNGIVLEMSLFWDILVWDTCTFESSAQDRGRGWI